MTGGQEILFGDIFIDITGVISVRPLVFKIVSKEEPTFILKTGFVILLLQKNQSPYRVRTHSFSVLEIE